ncbi:UNVERIFIED_CONTAM: sulfatase maturation enzyme AslB (radical SAM superfamily) [Paenibacillus sp. PvR008]
MLEFRKITRLMDQINSIAHENNIAVGHFMVSNGYLLTAERAKILGEIGVKRIKITINGCKSSHDQRRILANNNGIFDKIMKNIE